MGIDQDEFIEIVIENPGSYSLSEFAVDLYNGNGGESYDKVTLDNFTEGSTVGNFTIYSYTFSSNGIQNGPDGICLSYQGILISLQFLSYEGSFEGTNGPANTKTSIDTEQKETGSTPVGHSLQLTGTGAQYDDFIWESPAANTKGSPNNNQTIGTDTEPPVWTTDYPYIYSLLDTKGQVAVSMDEPGKVYYILLFDGATAPDANQVITGKNYDTVTVLVHDSIDVTESNKEYLQWILDSNPETAYEIYLIAKDDETTPNIQATPILLEGTTSPSRSLAWVKPEVNDTFDLGDSLHFEWNSANINNVMIEIYSHNANMWLSVSNDETGILEFILIDTTGTNITTDITIDNQVFTVDVEILFGYDSETDSLVPEIVLSEGATSDPASGDTVDFSTPATFTVTAEDELITQDWTITVTVAAAENSENDILSFELDKLVGEVVIDTVNHTVTAEVEYLTDLTTLTPAISVSEDADISPGSGTSRNFTNPVIYTVTAQDGTTQDWTITVTREVIPDRSIYDIQYTSELSGDSPCVDQQVRVTGTVTAINIYQDEFNGYYLQDSSSTWNGLYVYDPDGDSTEPGDSITVVATVDEYYDVTRLKDVIEYVKKSTGNSLPDPIAISTGLSDNEPYEGILVIVDNAECTDNDLGDDEVELNDGSGTIIIDDYLYNYTGTETFTINNLYRIKGIMYYSNGHYKIIPRSSDDIEDVTWVKGHFTTSDIRIYPNPNKGLFKLIVNNIKTGSLVIEIMNLQGQILYKDLTKDPKGFNEYIDLTKYDGGLYLLRVINGTNTSVMKILIR